MNVLACPENVSSNASYQASRLNALQHGILSRHAVLPWEDRTEYQALLAALVSEHTPQGPTEEHLVEELAGIFWRKRRLQLAEAAIFRDKLRQDAVCIQNPDQIASAALMPVIGKPGAKANMPQALAATATDTTRDLRDVRRDQAMSNKAHSILTAGEPDAYGSALKALREDTRSYWLACLDDPPRDGLRYQPTAEALEAWLRRNWTDWYEGPIAELEHRDAIREQAFGSAYSSQRLDVTARYEVHLDRKLERTLAMLFRLRELSRPAGGA